LFPNLPLLAVVDFNTTLSLLRKLVKVKSAILGRTAACSEECRVRPCQYDQAIFSHALNRYEICNIFTRAQSLGDMQYFHTRSVVMRFAIFLHALNRYEVCNIFTSA